jgi:hypothetical protein
MSRPGALALFLTRLLLARLLLASIAFAALPFNTSQAAIILTNDEAVIVQPHEVIEDDLIVFAPYVRIDGVVKGDLVAVGEEVVVEGIVEGDLIAAAKTVYLNGSANDDARLVAYAVALGESARVADDFFDLSYSVEAQAGSRIGGSLHAASRQVLLAGQVVEDALVRAGALLLEGITGGDVRAVVGGLEGVTHSSLVIDLALEIPSLPDGITLAGSAAIGGDLDYRALNPAAIEPGATIAGATRREAWQPSAGGPIRLPDLEDGSEPLLGELGQEAVERLAAMLILGLILAVAAPRWLRDTADTIRDEPMGMFGWGLGGVIFAAMLSVILGIAFLVLFTLALSTDLSGLALTSVVAGALLQGALGALFAIALFFVSPVVASAAIGRAILERIRPSVGDPVEAPVNAALVVVVGVVAYTLARAVPWFGPIFGIGAALLGLGVLAIWLRDCFSGAD